jgi:hypothetical protein
VRVELTASRRVALHRYTFPKSSREPRIVVDITNDGLISNTEPVINVNTTNGRVTGKITRCLSNQIQLNVLLGGARFAASFGPGRYSVYTCVDFKGHGYDFDAPTEYGVWLGNSPDQYSTQFIQLYSGLIISLIITVLVSQLHNLQASCPKWAPC